MQFHNRCGDRVTLLNDKTTAVRNFVEFNHGLILSAEPIKDDVLFEICVDRKVHVWNGSLEIGVTTLDPEYMELPATATKLRNTAWIMSGSSIVKDGVTLINSYGPELDTLREGDCLGVMRTSKAELMFFLNGRCLGIAATDLPPRLFAVIDLYGQCVQVSILNAHGMRPIMESSLDQIEEDPNNDDTLTSSEMDSAGLQCECPKVSHNVYIPMTSDGACALVSQDRLRFHSRCGILVKLSLNNKTAERVRPLDDYNNGVVMTHRPLYDNELFEIRIDRLVDKWSGSIEVGVTTHNPATMRFPSTMTNMDSGTIMMSGCKILVNGQGSCMEYGNFNLDELREGDTVGMLRKPNGKLHYFINGVDQGVATDNLEQQVWGVIDLYGMTVKVSIVDICELVDSNVNNVPMVDSEPEPTLLSRLIPRIEEDSLLFHSLRDSTVIIINDGKTAHRPNAFELFNNGIVMTNRTLRTNELFQVRLDLVVPKWAGSIEIGVTQHSSNDIQFPFKMSSAKSGIWAMTGEDIIHDGIVIIPQYVRNLNRLVEGDTVGVMRKEIGILHFFVNGVDQGPAAFNIPEHVFGIIDLYGRVAQATIVDMYFQPIIFSPESPLSTESNFTIFPEMCFHRVHGRNARLSRNRLTASRATFFSEFNDAVLFSSRPLRECDMFELRIDKMIDCWIGSLEIGVTAIRPDDLEASGGVGAIAGTATDLSWDTYILSGAAMMKDGECVRSGYPLDLDTLTVGSRVGMMWHADRSLHYYLDGMDMGKAWYVPHLNIYAVVDLYGQCTQVTIMQNEERTFNYNGCANSDNTLLNPKVITSPPQPYWSFSEYCGENACLMHAYTVARRVMPDPTSALVFSSFHLTVGEIFEIRILESKYPSAGSLRMGVTDVNILNAHVNRCFPPSIAYLPHYTAFIDGRYMKYSRPDVRVKDQKAFAPSFEWLRPGDRIGFKKSSEGRVFIYYNSELLDIAFEKVPDKVYAVIEIYGYITKIQTVPKGSGPSTLPQHTIPNGACIDTIANDEGAPITFVDPAIDAVTTPTKDSDVLLVTSEIIKTIEVPMEMEEVTTASNETVGNTVTSGIIPSPALSTINAFRRKRKPLPYTFHYVHGRNLKLCSSDTVAIRTRGYRDGIAIVSTPLSRGKVFRFRVDKINEEWSGSVLIGAVGKLSSNDLPRFSLHLDPPVWIISCNELYDDGVFTRTSQAAELDKLKERAVLTLTLDLNGELTVDIDGKATAVICKVPEQYGHVYPLVDVYGKVQQVSILLHPLIMKTSASLDLQTIIENAQENNTEDQGPLIRKNGITKLKLAESSNEDEIFLEHLLTNQPGPSIAINNVNDNKSKDPLHIRRSVTLEEKAMDNLKKTNSPVRRSHSIHNFNQGINPDYIYTENTRWLRSYTDRIQPNEAIFDIQCDTNIKHNDQYPEIEEPSTSLEGEDLYMEPFEDNLCYLYNVINADQDLNAVDCSDAEWLEMGERCTHLRAVLNYLNPLRQAVMWGQVRCYCSSCQPEAEQPFTGWVRMERMDGVCATHRAYWHVRRSVVSTALSELVDCPHLRRPHALTTHPSASSPLADVWFDEESKGHYVVLAIEIDIENSEPENDRLLSLLVYMKPW